jgi:hypothetical protein
LSIASSSSKEGVSEENGSMPVLDEDKTKDFKRKKTSKPISFPILLKISLSSSPLPYQHVLPAASFIGNCSPFLHPLEACV